MIEFISQLKLGHHEKPGSTGLMFRLIVGLLSNAHPRTLHVGLYRIHQLIR
ncbi:unnamed protein product, partial [Schistosoma intercalatum]